MEGISKARLIVEMKLSAHLGYNEQRRTIQGLIDQCKELNPWQPIKIRDRHQKKVQLYEKSYGQWIGYRDEPNECGTYATHWQELPEDPKE